MNQCDRIRLILMENDLKQRDFATTLSVTESYISMLLKNPDIKLSRSIAALIEEKYGYSASWVLTGEEPKIKRVSKTQGLSELHQKALTRLEKMNAGQIKAVLAFINSLEEIEKSLSASGQGNIIE